MILANDEKLQSLAAKLCGGTNLKGLLVAQTQPRDYAFSTSTKAVLKGKAPPGA
jgi:hypothetical protein